HQTESGGKSPNTRLPPVHQLGDALRVVSYFQVACPNSPVESVIRLVGHGNYLIQGLELGNAEYGPENLIAANSHLPVDILEDSGFDEISLLQSRVSRPLSSAK